MSLAGLRIGLVGPVPPPAGGMAMQTRQLAELLRSEQSAVLLVASNAAYRPAFVAGIPFVRAGFRLAAYAAALWHTAGRSDVIHVMANSGWSWHLFAAPAILLGHVRGVPVIVNYRGGGAAEFLARSQALVRFSMRRAARLVVPSAFLQEVFERFGMAADIVPNVIDLARFHPRGPRTTGSAHLVVARNLEALYDNATALRAFSVVRARLPHARLTLAGSGPEEQRLRLLAAELGLAGAVHFAGRLERDAMAALYREADLVLNASLADNMPNSVLEALACGVPVVSTDVGGVPYLLQHERTALLVSPADAQAMAAAALRVLEAPELWARLAEAGLAEVQRYTWLRVAPLLERVYGDALRRA